MFLYIFSVKIRVSRVGEVHIGQIDLSWTALDCCGDHPFVDVLCLTDLSLPSLVQEYSNSVLLTNIFSSPRFAQENGVPLASFEFFGRLIELGLCFSNIVCFRKASKDVSVIFLFFGCCCFCLPSFCVVVVVAVLVVEVVVVVV